MTSPQQKSLLPSIYAVMGDHAREQALADVIARLGAADALAPGTFFPPERLGNLSFEAAWADWLEKDFEGWLGRFFIEIHGCADRMESERIAEMDREIDRRLGEGTRERGRTVARAYLEGRREVRSQPQWLKYIRAWEAGEIPGQITAAFSLQAALFHLPLLTALNAYVNWEGVNGLAAMAGGRRLTVVEFASRYPVGLEAARRVFRSEAAERGNDSEPSPVHLSCL